ncbi:ATP-dependent helicase [Mesomycoplasma neurolyticum]|uniref:DNA 3'-5' helicase n=1 Tax=Mesomycoplasma neurolyticum TaxID=2120 RepID=A0A449A4F7_9BACT|nr:UvrD-helicase domain-containing protein [Mesomycoplasma neurolyticum]VEU59094.1 ATP-dependent DNA helicase UvrD/PcrA [Mesomycoplasma neurolyticum]
MEAKIEKLISILNPQQKEAVVYNDSHLKIIAGAGSGKTGVLTRKIAYLIETQEAEPDKILAVTFTNKAANEMLERVEGLITHHENDKKPYIMTFHSFCNLVLRREIHNFKNFDAKFDILDTSDQKTILESIYNNLALSPKDISYSSALETISKWKNYEKSYDQIDKEILDEKELKILQIYKLYDEELKKMKVLDFDDLLLYTLKLFEKFPSIAQKWKNRFSHILIDEFQDTSIIQLRIIEHLISEKNKITIVGDPNQSIYSWRGADANLINDFDKKFPNVHIIKLSQNYRSTKRILDSANKLIKNNKTRVDNDLFTEKENFEEIEFYHGFSLEAEARWVINKINELKKKKSQLKNIAILYRSNFYSRYFEDMLIKENIPYKILGSQKFYEKKIIKDVIAFLKVIDHGSTIALTRIINVPPKKIGPSTINKILEFAKKRKLELFDSLIEYFKNFKNASDKKRKELDLTTKTKQELVEFLNKINWARACIAKNKSIADTINQFLKLINYFSIYQNNTQNVLDFKEAYENFNILLQSIKNWEKQNPEKKISDYLIDISVLTDLNSISSSVAINLMTVHNSKGLEFENVFLVGMSEGIFPNNKTLDNDESIEEERRLAYVAITRAKERLFISNSSKNYFDNKRENLYKTSRFVEELELKAFKLQTFTKIDQITGKLSYAKNKKDDFIVGDAVNHLTFGFGVIVEIIGDIAHISFKNEKEIKKIKKDHKSLEKVI